MRQSAPYLVSLLLASLAAVFSTAGMAAESPPEDTESTNPILKKYGVNVEGDFWYTMWEGLGHVTLTYDDYDISPTMLYGATLSGFFRTSQATWFGAGVSYLSDFQQQKISDAFGEEFQKATELVSGLLLFNFGKSYHFYTRVLWGRFNGVLQAPAPYGWQTDFLLGDLAWVRPPQPKDGESGSAAGGMWFGFGLRMIRYDQPMEVQFYKEGKEAGGLITKVYHNAFCLNMKMMDSSHFGVVELDKWFYGEGGLGFGVAVDNGEGLPDNLYGFDFNFDVDLGLKHVFPIGKWGIGLRAGYRAFGDLFILAEWDKGEDQKNTTTTQINIFHGPFVSANLSF